MVTGHEEADLSGDRAEFSDYEPDVLEVVIIEDISDLEILRAVDVIGEVGEIADGDIGSLDEIFQEDQFVIAFNRVHHIWVWSEHMISLRFKWTEL